MLKASPKFIDALNEALSEERGRVLETALGNK